MKLITIQNKSISSKVNVKIAIATVFLEPSYDFQKSFLIKREAPEECTKCDESMEGSNMNSENYWNYLKNKTYYFNDLNYVDNLKLNLQSIETLSMGGITTLKLNEILMAQHRKKINTRILENLQNEKNPDKKLKVQPTRSGKNFYVKYWMDNKECQKKLSSMNYAKNKCCKLEDHVENKNLVIEHEEEQNLNQKDKEKHDEDFMVENQGVNVILQDRLIVRMFEKVYQSYLEHDKEGASHIIEKLLQEFQIYTNFYKYVDLRSEVEGYE